MDTDGVPRDDVDMNDKNKGLKALTSAGLVLGVVIAIVAPAPAMAQARSIQAGWSSYDRVIPDSDGALDELLLQFDPYLTEELSPVYRDLFAALPKDVRLTVLCPSVTAAEGFVDQWQSRLQGRSVNVVNVGLQMSVWARDRLVARQPMSLRGRARSFISRIDPEYEPEKYNDLLVQEMLGDSRFMPGLLDTQLLLEGGNVVSDKRFAFIGSNALADNAQMDVQDMLEQMEETLGRTFVAVGDGDGTVPWPHVDMYLTPLGDGVALVADPRLGQSILAPGCEEDCQLDIFDTGPLDACVSDAVQERFDRVAAMLVARGYRVIRLPTVVNAPDAWMITYNNVLLDRRGTRRVVYMPVYDLPEMDDVAAAVYRKLGFEVKTVNVSRVYTMGGAVRCLANVVERISSDSVGKERVTRSNRLHILDLEQSGVYRLLIQRSTDRLTRRAHPADILSTYGNTR